MPGSNGNGLRPEEEIAQNVGSPAGSAGQGNTKSALGWAGLGLGVVDTVANLYMTDRQNRLNREESERARQHNIDMWNMQNAYNHPAAQMERLREAGLNPNLVYGIPDITGNNANAPEDSKTHYERPNDLDMLGMAMNAQQFAKQDELMALEIERAELENEDKRISNDMKAYELSQQESRRQEEIRQRNQEIIESNKRIDEMDQNIKVGVEQALLFVEEQGVSRNRATLIYRQSVAQELENRFNSATFNERVESVKLEPKLKKVYMSYYRELARYYAGASELNESLLSPAGSVSNENYVQRQYTDAHDNIVQQTSNLVDTAKMLGLDVGRFYNKDGSPNQEYYNFIRTWNDLQIGQIVSGASQTATDIIMWNRFGRLYPGRGPFQGFSPSRR